MWALRPNAFDLRHIMFRLLDSRPAPLSGTRDEGRYYVWCVEDINKGPRYCRVRARFRNSIAYIHPLTRILFNLRLQE